MSLVKLWNSLRRRSKEHSAGEEASAPIAEQPARTAKATPKRRLFGGGPHANLCRQLKGLDVKSVLEISVGDGTRALAVLETLHKQSAHSVRYVAVDQFELAGSELGLREFFRLLRSREITPQLFPETVDDGLRRVANTIGAVDLVVIAAGLDQWQNPVTLQLLSRITHSQTAIFFEDGAVWARYQPESRELRRAG